MARAKDPNEYKRKVIIEGSNPKTTKASLDDYLSEYQIDSIDGPFFDQGTKTFRAIGIFYKASNVNNLMSKRPHRIDGQEVAIYRLVPDQELNKEKQGIKTLIVAGIKNASLNQSDLLTYFGEFGTIGSIDMNYGDNICRIEFEDYDSVDKALLDVPHMIRKVRIEIKKGDRNNQVNRMVTPRLRTSTSEIDIIGTGKKTNLKQVQINSQPTTIHYFKPKYCIHVTNLPSNVDAEILSTKFKWSIYNILMATPLDDSSLQNECWLKDINDLQEAETVVQRCNGQTVLGTKIQCQIEEDKQELCKQFRLGQCERSNDKCNWTHITCSANGKCQDDCPYGHAKGEKTGSSKNESNGSYQLKISGLQTNSTRKNLARKLHMKEYKILVKPKQQIGYIVKLKTFHYTRGLMKKWHNKDAGDGQTWKCQIELFRKSSLSKASSKSHLSQNEDTENVSSDDDDDDDDDGNEETEPRIVSDQDINCDGRLFAHSYDLLIKQKESDNQRKAKSTETLSSADCSKSRSLNNMSAYKEAINNERTQGGRQMTQLRKRDDHGSFAFLIEYKNTHEENYHRELIALKLLKDVKGVVQLIELEAPSNNMKQQRSNRNEFHFVTEQPPGYSLIEFINQIHRGGFRILEAVQLVQNLITIVKQVHSKGVLHQNLAPENIMIEWNSKQTSIDQAQLTLINFSQAYIRSNKSDRMSDSTAECWYRSPQANVDSLKYSSTIDASSICAILLWLLTNTEPRHDRDHLPHEREDVEDKINRKITETIRIANSNRKQPLEETQLKTYLIDTFNIGFGYPQHQPWTINDLECRLESIYELLSPRNPKMNTIETVFHDFLSTSTTTAPTISVTPGVHQDIFQKASDAFKETKTNFAEYHHNQYSWSDGGCTWLDSTQTSPNERRHDDILTYYSRDRHMLSNCSIIIICLATVNDNGNIITLSIGSTINGKMSRIPIGRYSRNQNFIKEFQDGFTTELKNLIISICKERRALQ